MAKMKTGIVLLVALCLLVLFAFLPGITAKITDAGQKNRAGFGEITTVSLNLSSEDGQLSIVEKLLLLQSGNTYPIGESEAQFTASEALGWIESFLSQYSQINEFSWFDFPNYQAMPGLCIDENNPEKHCVYWIISIVDEGEFSRSLTVIADDETGTILFADYVSSGMEEWGDVVYANVLDSLCQLYLDQLNVASAEYIDREPTENTFEEPSRSYAQQCFILEDSEGNRIVLELVAESNGSFCTNFSN